MNPSIDRISQVKELGVAAVARAPDKAFELEEALEISELRRLAVEISEPEPKYFTGT